MGPWTSGLLSYAYSFPFHFLNTSKLYFVNSYLFIFFGNGQSRAHPREIMTEVLKALQELNVCWKKIGHYNMKCRWLPGYNGTSEDMHANNSFGDESAIVESNDAIGKSPNVVKFEVQVSSFSSSLHLYYDRYYKRFFYIFYIYFRQPWWISTD